MYNLSYFKENNQATVIEFMKKHEFAFLAGCDGNRVEATQLPMLFEERNGKMILLGHMMRKQDHHKAFEKNPEVLVLFTGAHSYVSGTWYSNNQQASTWNYMSVHARGTIRFTDEAGLREILRKVTLHYENNNPHSSTIFDNLSEDYISKLINAIVGFEIEVNSIENVFKLSQNRDEQSYHSIMEKLNSQGGDAQVIASEMEKRTSQLFNQ